MNHLETKDKTDKQLEKDLQRLENEGGVHTEQARQVNPAIRVLLIGGSDPEDSTITESLQRDTAPSFLIYRCHRPQEAVGFLKENNIDVIFLDFGVIEQHNAEEIFQGIRDSAEDTPVIIFTGETEHDLALLIMKEGTADSITRERFSASPKSLIEAIELSLARKKVAAANAADILRNIRKRAATELKKAQEAAATELKETQEAAATELRHTESKAAALLREVHKKRLNDARYHRQVISWMSGGYSVDTTEDKKGDDGEREAAELEHAQKKRARKLKESQIKRAERQKRDQKRKALHLREKQQEEELVIKKSQE